MRFRSEKNTPKKSVRSSGFVCCLLLLLLRWPVPVHGAGIGLFVGDSDAYTCARALAQAGMPAADIQVFTDRDMDDELFPAFAASMDVAVVDIMQRQPAEWLLEHRDLMKPGIRIYAVRRSSHTKDFTDAGFRMDREVRGFYAYTSAGNIANMLRFLAHRDLGENIAWDAPVFPPENALYHPDAAMYYETPSAYVDWYKASGHYSQNGLWDLTVIFPTSTLDGRKEAVDALVRAYEDEGINVMVWIRDMTGWNETLERFVSAPPLSGSLGSVTGFAFKFSSMFTVDLLPVLNKANVPVINAQNLFFSSEEEWLESDQGISSVDLAFQFSNPEISGLVEPTVTGVKRKDTGQGVTDSAYCFVPVDRNVRKLARRTARWHALKRKANSDKQIFLMYYNHGAGKQNIGASYLNVFRSIREIIARLQKEGYRIEGDFSEETIKDLLIKSGRNIGSWAPDELDTLLREGNAVLIDMAEYREWLSRTPVTFQKNVEKDWGIPEKSSIMVKGGKFVVPCLRLGNLTLAPQPVRGFEDDPEKLYHSTVLYPHHQYNAFYYWIQEKLCPDAMISLGTHGTHEWLPGKQSGLSWECAPEVLIGDIPNLYPYIVDDVGEGIQAKRRGRGVIIDHATPPFKAGDAYEEYVTLRALIGEYESAMSEDIKTARLDRIREMTLSLGLDKDLSLSAVDKTTLETIEHYLKELQGGLIPYGLHTFGKSPEGEALSETARALSEITGGDKAAFTADLAACGPSEMDSLVRGLSGGYIPPASGNDPIRNPESLPTGKNFYAFDPEKVPSKEAWAAGKRAAGEIIEAYGKKHNGDIPEQVGVVLWSVETIRDEGINVATALCLMGMKPVWNPQDKVTGTVPSPARELDRPRIDVLLQMSGLFRDTFPTVALMLDSAVKQAAAMTDVENFIRKHSNAVADNLIRRGMLPDEAKKKSLIRLFSAPPGAYGTKVDDMAGASGKWEDDNIVSDQGFVAMQSYGYSVDDWGEKMEDIYREHLKSVDATVHTISSNLYGTMDNDDMFQYLGGLSMAVSKASGKDPEVFVSIQRTGGEGHVEALSRTLGREMRSRYLNPKWIEGMKRENYAGAREIADFMENMWGWQVTTPGSVDESLWEQSYEVYVQDKYGQEMKTFFNRENPWAYQSMTARMLEAVRKDYWHAESTVVQKIAAAYAVNVVEKGVACCEHTCNNPLLNQMVVSIISLPGIVSPEIVEQFKLAVEKMAAMPLSEQVEQRKALLESLQAGSGRTEETPAKETGEKERIEKSKEATESETVEGYRMEDMNIPDDSTRMSSSGIKWAASLLVLLLIGLFFWGSKHRR